MSTATTTTAENAGLPAMLDTKDVAEMSNAAISPSMPKRDAYIIAK